MYKQSLLYFSFFSSYILLIIGSFFRIMHWPSATLLLMLGIIILVFFLLISMFEIINSKKIDGTEKFIWITGLLFFGLIIGLIYILSSRKRII